jgi:hypothetical protein
VKRLIVLTVVLVVAIALDDELHSERVQAESRFAVRYERWDSLAARCGGHGWSLWVRDPPEDLVLWNVGGEHRICWAWTRPRTLAIRGPKAGTGGEIKKTRFARFNNDRTNKAGRRLGFSRRRLMCRNSVYNQYNGTHY